MPALRRRFVGGEQSARIIDLCRNPVRVLPLRLDGVYLMSPRGRKTMYFNQCGCKLQTYAEQYTCLTGLQF